MLTTKAVHGLLRATVDADTVMIITSHDRLLHLTDSKLSEGDTDKR